MRQQVILILKILFVGYVPLQASQQQVQLFSPDAIVEDSEKAACEVLKTRFAELYIDTKKHDRYWFCDFTTNRNNYVRIVGLRSSAPRREGATIYSNLLGWYAVARRSHVVVQWDLNQDRLISIGDSYDARIVDDSERAACDVLKSQVAGVLKVNERPEPSWVCEFLREKNDYLYMIALRSVSEPSNQTSTRTLVGKFAVAKRSELVFGLDDAGNRLVALRARLTK